VVLFGGTVLMIPGGVSSFGPPSGELCMAQPVIKNRMTME
jgi:hypothetical protein